MKSQRSHDNESFPSHTKVDEIYQNDLNMFSIPIPSDGDIGFTADCCTSDSRKCVVILLQKDSPAFNAGLRCHGVICKKMKDGTVSQYNHVFQWLHDICFNKSNFTLTPEGDFSQTDKHITFHVLRDPKLKTNTTQIIPISLTEEGATGLTMKIENNHSGYRTRVTSVAVGSPAHTHGVRVNDFIMKKTKTDNTDQQWVRNMLRKNIQRSCENPFYFQIWRYRKTTAIP